MKRRFSRSAEQPVLLPRQLNIACIGLGRDAGTTLISSSLAIYFAENGESVTFLECARPDRTCGLLYDAVAMDQRFYGRTFRSAYAVMRGGGRLRDVSNLERGVNWWLLTPDDRRLPADEVDELILRLAASARNQVCVFDVQDPAFPLSEMDLVLCIVDPLPSRLASQTEQIARMRQLAEGKRGPEVVFLVTKVSAAVNRRAVRGLLGVRGIEWVPAFPAEELYRDEYTCRFHWDNPVIREELAPLFTKLSHKIPR